MEIKPEKAFKKLCANNEVKMLVYHIEVYLINALAQLKTSSLNNISHPNSTF